MSSWRPNIAYVYDVWKAKKLVDEAYKPDGVVMLLPGQSLEGINFSLVGPSPKHLTNGEIERLKLITGLNGQTYLDLFEKTPDQICLTDRMSNLFIPGEFEKLSFETVFLFAVAGFLYGGVHASSWNGHFPSGVEKTMWRTSACSVGGGGFVILILSRFLWAVWNGELSAQDIMPSIRKWTDKISSWIWKVNSWLDWGDLDNLSCGFSFLPTSVSLILGSYVIGIVSLGIGLVLSIVGIVVMIAVVIGLGIFAIVAVFALPAVFASFCLSRVFLVVEAFISIRSLPAGAYDTVSWVGVLPHIGG